MIVAHHLIWTAYGWWLPNDPRGSTSRTIACDVIAEMGELHYGRKSVQPASREIREFYQQAEERLQHALVEFSEQDIDQIAAPFADTIARNRYTCWACAIMPDHVHVLIRKHRDKAEQMIAKLEGDSRQRLIALGRRHAEHPVWGGPGWKVFLDHPDEVRRTIRYIESNPVKLGRPRQRWAFAKPYDGWPLHPGHSPNSPYVRRKRGEPFRDLP